MIERAVAIKEKGTIVMAGSGAQRTRDAVAFTEDAGRAGADAVLVVNPFYYKGLMTADALVAHFEAVADASTVPVLLYSVAMFTGMAIPTDVVERLAAHENIVGMKDSSGDLRSVQTFLERTPPEFQVLNGSAAITGMSATAGAVGAILAMGNVVPDLCVELFETGAADEMEKVRELQTTLNFLTREIQGAYGIPGIKAAAELLGGFGGSSRAPIQPLTDEARKKIGAALEQVGIEPGAS